MPLDSSIPFQSIAPDPMVSLNSMLDMGTKSLSLQKNRATFDADVARSKAESSTAESGAEVNRANIKPLIQQQAAQTQTAQTGASSAAFGFEQKKTQAAQQGMMELIQNKNINDTDPSTYNHEEAIHTVAGVRDYLIANGQDKAKVESISARLIAAAGQPGGISGIMKQQIRAGLTPSENASASTPSGISVSDNINSQTVNTNPMALGGVGSTIPGTAQTQKVPLGNQQSVGADQNGNPTVMQKDAYGRIQAPQSMPGSNAKPLVNLPAGESAATKGVLEGEAMTAKNTALNAPSIHANNKGILEALNEVIATGPAGKGLAKLSGYTGLAFDSAEKAASAYDTIGKLAEKNALAAAASMGTATNAQLEAQVKANGSASYNPTALRNITKLNDALVTGSEKYATGMQKAIDEAGHVFGKRQFDQQWAQNAHVDTLKFLNAVKTADKQEQAALVKSVGGIESQGGQRLIQQMKNLQKLTQTGSL